MDKSKYILPSVIIFLIIIFSFGFFQSIKTFESSTSQRINESLNTTQRVVEKTTTPTLKKPLPRFEVRDAGVFFIDVAENEKIVNGADINTFSHINAAYGKDTTHVYIGETMILHANPKSFELLGDLYSRDTAFVYYDENIIQGAEANTIKYVGSIYAKDSKHVFSNGQILEVADSQTFTYVGGPYAKDKTYVFGTGGNIVQEADPKTFVQVKGDHSKDATHVFLGEDIRPGADPAKCTPDNIPGCF